MNNYIKLSNINFSYNKNKKVIFNFSYEFEKGNIYCLVGLNGSGKTTLCNLIANLYQITEGEINYFDETILTNKKKIFKKINSIVSIIFQFSEKQLFAETALEDVKYGLKNYGFKDEEATKIALKYLNYFNFPNNLINQSIFNLSEGQKRKVALSGILCLNKEVLILDEPTISLDYETKLILTKLILEYKNNNKLVIIVSHDFDWIYEFADQILLLNDGKLIFHSSYDKFFKSEIVNKIIPIKPFVEEVISKLKVKDNKFNILDKFKFRNIIELTNKIKEIMHN